MSRRAEIRYAKRARIGYAQIISEYEQQKRMIARAAERLLTPEEALGRIRNGESPLR